MRLFGFGKRESFLAIVTSEGQGRLRLNGVRVKDPKARKSAIAHERVLCWVEFTTGGGMIDKGIGKATAQAGQADRLLRDLPTNPTCRAVLDRLREGQDSVAKWLQLGETAGK